MCISVYTIFTEFPIRADDNYESRRGMYTACGADRRLREGTRRRERISTDREFVGCDASVILIGETYSGAYSGAYSERANSAIGRSGRRIFEERIDAAARRWRDCGVRRTSGRDLLESRLRK